MSCTVCFSSFEETKPIQLECSCVHCYDCLASWIQMQINELEYYTFETVKCMSSSCRKPFRVQDIIYSFPEKTREELDTALLNFHLRSAKDIRKCPKGNCDYAGTIDLTSSCTDNLECSKCGMHWREKTHFSLTENAINVITNFEFRSSEAFSEAWEEFFTNKCPSCYVNIERSGGCPHMTCKKCGYEFCWHCKQGHKNHLARICLIRHIIKIVFLSAMLFHILYLTGIIAILETIFVWLLNLGGKACFFNLFLYIVRPIFDKRNWSFSRLLGEGIKILFYATLIGAFILIVHIYNMYLNLFMIFTLEVCAIGGIIFYSQFLSNWLYTVY